MAAIWDSIHNFENKFDRYAERFALRHPYLAVYRSAAFYFNCCCCFNDAYCGADGVGFWMVVSFYKTLISNAAW